MIIFIVPKNSGLEKYKDLIQSDSAKKIEVRGEDVPMFLYELGKKGKRAIGITGEDLFSEFISTGLDSGLRISRVVEWDDDECIFSKPCFCLLGGKGGNLSSLCGKIRVCVNAKYKKLFEEYAKKNLPSLDFEIIYAKGATEEFFKEGFVDLVAEIVCSGKSMSEAGLEVYDQIFLSDVVVIENYSNAILKSLNFDKMNGLIPTILKDEFGTVLTLVYSNKESIKRSLGDWKPYFFSRAGKKVCLKGQTSGNTQELLDIKVDCDNDSLLFIVSQKGNVCHFGDYSCFKENKVFNLDWLYDVVLDRVLNEKDFSYTRELLDAPNLLNRKIVEEAGEVITATDKKNLIWEISDIFYFLLVKMACEGISMKGVCKENYRRNKETLLKVDGLSNMEDKNE